MRQKRWALPRRILPYVATVEVADQTVANARDYKLCVRDGRCLWWRRRRGDFERGSVDVPEWRRFRLGIGDGVAVAFGQGLGRGFAYCAEPHGDGCRDRT